MEQVPTWVLILIKDGSYLLSQLVNPIMASSIGLDYAFGKRLNNFPTQEKLHSACALQAMES
jgi:hypothetical protein